MIINVKVTYRAVVQQAVDVAVPSWHAVKQCTVQDNTLRVTTYDGDVFAFNLPTPGEVDVSAPDTLYLSDTAGKQLPPWGGSIPGKAFLSATQNSEIPFAYLQLQDHPGESQTLDFTVIDARVGAAQSLARFDLGDNWMIYKPDRLSPAIDARLQALMTDDWLAQSCGIEIAKLFKLERSVPAHTVKFPTTQGDLSYIEIVRTILSKLGLRE